VKNEHIETIRRQFGVALATIYSYNNEHKSEIDHISDIFYLNGDSKGKVLALLYVLALGEEDNAVKKYRKGTGLKGAEYDSANLLDKYKELLLTAMIYDPAFYAMAVNFRGFVNAGYTVAEVDKDSIKEIRPPHTVEKITVKQDRFFPCNHNKSSKEKIKVRRDDTADGPGYEPKEYCSPIRVNYEDGIYGDLVCLGNRKGPTLELRFRFRNKDTDQLVNAIPFKLSVEIFLNDNKKTRHTIKLDQVMNSSTIRSAPEKISYLDGFECEFSKIDS